MTRWTAAERIWAPACLVALALGIALGSGCGKREESVPEQPPPPKDVPARFDPAAINGERSMADVENIVAIRPRHMGSEGGRQAALFIHSRLKSVGYEDALLDEFEATTPDGVVTARNVLATLPGDGKSSIVLLSHFDTKKGIDPDFAGANDSGSSTGLLLELARTMRASATRTGPGIIFAFVDGEESQHSYTKTDGLHGSRRVAADLLISKRAEQVLAAIVIDMIGDRDLNITIPRNSTRHLVRLAFEAAKAEGKRDRIELTPGRSIIIDDHTPFLTAGIPAIDLIDFEYGSKPGRNDYWHTTEDTMDKLDAASLELAGRIVVRMVNALSTSPTHPQE